MTRSSRCLIYGAGGHGKVVLDILLALGRMRIAGFVDDARQKTGRRILGYPVLGRRSELPRLRTRGIRLAALGVADNRLRSVLAVRLAEAGLEVISAAHPEATIARGAQLGAGTVVMAGAVINPDAWIGQRAIINTGATVDHDCRIGDDVHLAPGVHLAGGVQVGRGAFLGLGVVVREGVSVGDRAVIGAGAVVLEDIPAAVVAVGAPARVVQRKGANRT